MAQSFQRFGIQLPDALAEQLRKDAKAAGVPVATYIRLKLFGKT